MYYQCKRKNCEYMKNENPCLFSEKYVKEYINDERNILCLAGEDIELEEIDEDNNNDDEEEEWEYEIYRYNKNV